MRSCHARVLAWICAGHVFALGALAACSDDGAAFSLDRDVDGSTDANDGGPADAGADVRDSSSSDTTLTPDGVADAPDDGADAPLDTDGATDAGSDGADGDDGDTDAASDAGLGDWSRVPDFVGDVRALGISDLGVAPLAIVAAGSGGVQRSIDDGVTWAPFNQGLTDTHGVSIGTFAGGTSLVLSTDRAAVDAGTPHVFLSMNAGAWTAKDITVPAAGTTPNDEHDVFAWIVLGGAGQIGCGVDAITGGPDVIQGKMGGAKWKVSPILPATTSQGSCRAIAGDTNDDLFAAVYAPGSVGGVLHSTDGQAASWTDSSAGIDAADRPFSFALAMSRSDAKTIYLGVRRPGGGRVYKTVDGAVSWSPAASGIPSSDDVLSLAVHPTDPNVAYAGTSSGIYKTADGGQTWHLSLRSNGARVTALAVHYIDGSVVFAGTDSSPGLWISRTGG